MLYLAFSLFCFFAFPAENEDEQAGARIASALQLAVALGFLGARVLPNYVRPRPWLWTYNTVVLWIGAMNTCMLPASIPLLKIWHKPETKNTLARGEHETSASCVAGALEQDYGVV